MAGPQRVSDASVYRLSLYHCYLSEVERTGGFGRITSGQIATELKQTEETVRRDLAHVKGSGGRPGSGHDLSKLLQALTDFLGLSDTYPVIKIGTADMLQALRVVFPAQRYGLHPVAYYSELPTDAGKTINGIEVKHLTELPGLDPRLGVKVALVACSPEWVQVSIDTAAKAGIRGVLLLTPSIKVEYPEGMEHTHVRMPCDLKSLACRCQFPDSRVLPEPAAL